MGRERQDASHTARSYFVWPRHLPRSTIALCEKSFKRKKQQMNQPKTADEQRNAAVIRELYASAEAVAKDTPKFVSLFAEGGYFYDVGAGKKIFRKGYWLHG